MLTKTETTVVLPFSWENHLHVHILGVDSIHPRDSTQKDTLSVPFVQRTMVQTDFKISFECAMTSKREKKFPRILDTSQSAHDIYNRFLCLYGTYSLYISRFLSNSSFFFWKNLAFVLVFLRCLCVAAKASWVAISSNTVKMLFSESYPNLMRFS